MAKAALIDVTKVTKVTKVTAVILLRCTLPQTAHDLPALAQAWCEASALGLQVQRLALSAPVPVPTQVSTQSQLYLYAALPQPRAVTPSELAQCRADWQARCPAALDLDVARLELVFDAPGASHDTIQPPTSCAHYVVEMDPEAGWAEELFSWYDKEHMPGLASVPGTIRARRYINHDAASASASDSDSASTASPILESRTPFSEYPYSIACYDLLNPEVLGSPPWLAVRGTAWSDRVRPHFMNTRRTMMGTLA